MTIKYPEFLDDDSNLYLVRDSLRIRLAEDYQPGDTSITVDPDQVMFDKFPPAGVITLTDQCSDIGVRALSFEYTSKGQFTFDGLTVLPGFTDVAKSKRITNVTQNVMADHHNRIKDALIAIQNFVGIKEDISNSPLSGTMEARTNFLRQLVLQPRSWFTASKRIGIVPLCVEFKDFSTGQPDLWAWDFGDGGMSVISGSANGDVSKCFYTPGVYDIELQVANEFGTNTVTIPSYITARVEAPDEATIEFLPTTSQILSGGVLRARTNQLITMLVDDTGEQPLDTIVSWEWEIADDSTHNNLDNTTASFGVGGVYDVKLRADTELGAYRTTVFEDVIDVVEKFNIWHSIFDPTASATATTKTAYVYEFGTISETYKAAHVSSATSITRDAGFLTGEPNYDQQYREFRRNNGFSPRSLTASGDRGAATVYWSEGGASSAATHPIRFREFNGFDNTWTTPVLENLTDQVYRQWNWLSFDSGTSVYFLLGAPGPGAFAGSPTNQTFEDVGLVGYSIDDIAFSGANYLNGGDELMENVGGGPDGDFSVYRGAWHDSSGYFVRNDGMGSFFRLRSFYRTEGTVSTPVQSIRKLTDMPGTTKFEGQMVSLSAGIYFFNNTGEVMLYNPVTSTWGAGGPGVGSPAFSGFQDKSVSGHDSEANTLLAVSDQSMKAYLFFDYSTKAQIKFNETDMTFSSLPVRPNGEQFVAGLY